MAAELSGTVRVRGEGGAESVVDVPPPGTHRREVFDEFVAKGILVVLDDPTSADTPERPAPADPDAVPDGTIGEVVDWVRGAPEGEDPADGWSVRAGLALEAEAAKPEPRKTLVKLLTEVLSAPGQGDAEG